MRRAFIKFGRLLEDPSSGIKLNTPKSMKVKHDYKEKSNIDIPALDKLMKSQRSDTMTDRLANLRCALCNTSNKVELHHLRSVKDIRTKIRTGNSTYAQ